MKNKYFDMNEMFKIHDGMGFFEEEKITPMYKYGNFQEVSKQNYEISKTEIGRQFDINVAGFSMDDIEIETSEKILSISLNKKSKLKYTSFVTENSYKFNLLQREEILDAQLENGILTITSKIEEQKEKTKKIKISLK